MASQPPRVQRLQSQMTAHSLDAIICTQPTSTFYLSGFNPIIYSDPVLVIVSQQSAPILLVHALRNSHARSSAWTPNIHLYGTWGQTPTLALTWPAALATLLDRCDLPEHPTIGIEHDGLPMTQYTLLRHTLPTANLANCTPLLHACRAVKDPDEIAHTRIAATLADHGMEAAVAALAQPSTTERDAVLAALQTMHTHWAAQYPDIEICDFGSLEGGVNSGLAAWVLSGPRQSFGCDNPTPRVPVPGESVSVFVWTVANGMHAELERTAWVGDVNRAQQRAMQAASEIRMEVLQRVCPGTAVRELYRTAQRGYERRGYRAYLPGRIGHSVGLGPHELFFLEETEERMLQAGMVLALEVNLLVPGVGGACVQGSDTFLVTGDGWERLTRFAEGVIRVRADD
ncbi:Xaa-Pro aminopeptidase [Aspergillus japonicus CBS 114.51]|uniref:Probable Xaa-Pro aminopeptidase P n=1 Tax=Aspergillus japonicus CBS 114.51 TaxID=1448312 RepID=A0A8T8WN36_ASPJA|nr:Xaa-Pro aminopeptidase [Aspergillus japonicus CBS 114.51]RAH77211.1 Xaa-Pro aminopeptidase [Aspergillus japonicus CBS 114.51]